MKPSSSPTCTSFSSIENRTDSDFGAFPNQTGDTNGSKASARTRPRLVKLRKQLHSVRARPVPSIETDADFNPFRCPPQVNNINDNAFSELSRGNVNSSEVNSSSDVSNGNIEFAFGRDSREREFNSDERKLGCEESGSESCRDSGHPSFVFGSKQSNRDANFYWEEKKLNSKQSGSGSGSSECRETQGSHKVQAANNLDANVKERNTCAFGSDSGSKKGSNISECAAPKCFYETKAEDESFINNLEEEENPNSKLHPHMDGKSKIQCETYAVDEASSLDQACQLQDELKKLIIDDFDNVDGTESSKVKATNPAFVFGSLNNIHAETVSDQTYEHPATTLQTDYEIKRNTINKHDVSGFGTGTSCSKPVASEAEWPKSSSGLSQCFAGQVKDDKQVNDSAKPFSFSLFGINLKPIGTFTEQSSTPAGKNKLSSTTSTVDETGVSFRDFQTPHWDPSSLKASLYPETNKVGDSSARSRVPKDKRSKKKKEKLSQRVRNNHNSDQDNVPKSTDLQENPSSPEYYSPMDFSPYQETEADNEFPVETPVALKQPSNLNDNFASSALESDLSFSPKDQGSVCRELNEENSGINHNFKDNCPRRGMGCEISCSCRSLGVNLFGTDVQETNRVQLPFASGLEDGKGNVSLRKHQLRKKYRARAFSSMKTTPAKPCAGTSALSNEAQSHREEIFRSQIGSETGTHVNQGSNLIAEACEMWRIRGNQAYRNGDLPKAEGYYTQGINSVPLNENSGCCPKPLVLCYSNRAATRISLGRMREALGDCEMAATLDPSFLKVYIRAGNCNLVLGETENALQYFNKCFESGADVCLDRRITIEAAEGLEKTQKVVELTNQATRLLKLKTSDAANSAIDMVGKALSISSCSEILLQLKADALMVLHRYEEVIKLCENTLHIAEKNFASDASVKHLATAVGMESENHSLAKLWRWHLISKSYFYAGKLEMALDFLRKIEHVGSFSNKHGIQIVESSNSLAATIHELLKYKNAGNEAVRAGRYTEAVEHYTSALSRNVESRSFTAICFCNRAAGHQALGQIADAIADCSLAIALDSNYQKAISRRAALHEMIRDYGQAAADFQRLVNILNNQFDKKAKHLDTPTRSPGSSGKELKQTRRQLSAAEANAKKAVPLDFYLILGIKTSSTASDIKKAYRKAALRHHPDKAAQFLVKSESGDELRLWKEIVDEVHKNADRLFKMIGEAYAVLSDTTKRMAYDFEEELRKSRGSKESNRSNSRRGKSDGNSYQYERRPSRPNWENGHWEEDYRWY